MWKKRNFIVMASFAMILLGVISVGWLYWHEPVPALTEVKVVRFDGYLDAKHADFEVPEVYWTELWQHLGPVKLVWNVDKWVTPGKLQLRLNSGDALTIQVFCFSERGVMIDGGAIKIGHLYFLGGNARKLVEILKLAYKTQQDNQP